MAEDIRYKKEEDVKRKFPLHESFMGSNPLEIPVSEASGLVGEFRNALEAIPQFRYAREELEVDNKRRAQRLGRAIPSSYWADGHWEEIPKVDIVLDADGISLGATKQDRINFEVNGVYYQTLFKRDGQNYYFFMNRYDFVTTGHDLESLSIDFNRKDASIAYRHETMDTMFREEPSHASANAEAPENAIKGAQALLDVIRNLPKRQYTTEYEYQLSQLSIPGSVLRNRRLYPWPPILNRMSAAEDLHAYEDPIQALENCYNLGDAVAIAKRAHLSEGEGAKALAGVFERVALRIEWSGEDPDLVKHLQEIADRMKNHREHPSA